MIGGKVRGRLLGSCLALVGDAQTTVLFSSVSASGLDAVGGRAPTCTHSPEVLAPGVPLGQLRLHQLSHRRELDGAPACPAQGSGVPSPKGQSLLGSHGAAPFLL